HLDHMRLAGGVVIFHNCDAAAVKPRIKLGYPRTLALSFGICCSNKPKGCRGLGILLAGSDHDPSIERRSDQLGQAIRNLWSLRRTFDPPAILYVKLRELFGRGLLDSEVRTAVAVSIDEE